MALKIVVVFYFIFSAAVHSFECTEQQATKILTEYQWYTEDYPPYNYRDENGKLVGIYPEILSLISQELKIDINLDDVLTVPWARLFHTLESYPNYAAFNMIKTPERSKKFQLISLPVITKVSIMVLSENKNTLLSKPIEKLTYAVVRQDIGDALLDKELKIENKVVTTSANSMLAMLLHNRVEAIAYSELVAKFKLNKLGLEDKKLASIYTLNDKYKTAFIFHKNTPACVTQLWAKTISTLDSRGEIAKVISKYQH